MKIIGVIVNYRTADMTAKAVSALLVELATVGPPLLYVVDNDSGDGSLERLRAAAEAEGWGERVLLIAAPRNGGYGYGINQAVERGMRLPQPPDAFYILNSDAFADAGALRAMVDFMDSTPDAGLVGGVIHGVGGDHQASRFLFPTALSELNLQARIGLLARLMPTQIVALPAPTETTACEWISGTSMLIRREVFQEVGLFDEGFFLYFEEVDFCRRAYGTRWKAYCVAAASITHIGSVSTGMADGNKRMPGYWFEARHRYFLKHHGRFYAALSDVCWTSGFILCRAKTQVLGRPDQVRPMMLRDFVRSSLKHLTGRHIPGPDDVVHESAAGDPRSSNGAARSSNGKDTRAAGDLGSLELLAEDFATYDYDLLQPGFWAVAVHRFGTRAADARLPAVRAASDRVYKLMSATVDWVWGINLPRSVELGRRVRIWHNGGMLLNARSIGDDVHIRHCTTFGPLRGEQSAPEMLPVIEERADIGSGACVMGPVRIGHDAVVGANSLVLKPVPPHAAVLGVPARLIPT